MIGTLIAGLVGGAIAYGLWRLGRWYESPSKAELEQARSDAAELFAQLEAEREERDQRDELERADRDAARAAAMHVMKLALGDFASEGFDEQWDPEPKAPPKDPKKVN